MRLIRVRDSYSKTGDSGDDYLITLFKDDIIEPLTLEEDITYQIKVGNDDGYLKTVSGTLTDDNKGIILSAKDLSELPDGKYYIEVWFDKDGLTYIYPSSGKAKIKLDANIETIKGDTIPAMTIDELRAEISKSTTIKGDKGEKGDPGETGESAYQIWLDAGNSGTETDFLNSLKGKDGQQGAIGATGPAGKDGADGKDGQSAYDIWLANGNKGTEQDFLSSLKGKDGANGAKGDKGDKGDTGAPGAKGDKGDKGDIGVTGKDGADGKSVYQVWLDLGNKGTEQDFLNSIKGPKGDNGDQGPQGEAGAKGDTGATGQDGKSAYQVWLDAGNKGTEQDFLSSLKGKDGANGAKGDKGDPGQPGAKGDKGNQGATGQDGKSAYQSWLDQGNTGTESDFINSLKGKDADPAQLQANTKKISELETSTTDMKNNINVLSDNDTGLQAKIEGLTSKIAELKEANDEATTRHAPTGWTLDRTTTPWTIHFNNDCGLQFPDYGDNAAIYGYGFVADEHNANWSVYPLVPNIIAASHGALTLDTVKKGIDPSYFADSTKVINPIRDDVDKYDWSNVYCNDNTRYGDGTWKAREKNIFRVMYQLGIWSIDDIKPFGLKDKQ